MSIRFFSSRERKKLLSQLHERFGIQDLDYFFLQAGKEKIRAFSGTLSADELVSLSEFARVEFAGLYFAKEEHFGFRLGLDAVHLLAPRITDHILEITSEQAVLWMQGMPLEKDVSAGVYVLKSGEDFLGCGYSTGTRIYNYVPKERCIRKR